MKGTTMKSIGIICEYNPFHNGHAHQLHTLRTTYPDALRIAIMSGSFVQRGEPAYFSKFDRARWAIRWWCRRRYRITYYLFSRQCRTILYRCGAPYESATHS